MAETLLETTLCYIERGGCYLLMHRIKKEKDVNKDKWVGIGGKCESGEDALACVRREALEETGLVLSAPAYRGIVDFYCPPWPAERMHLFTCAEGAWQGDAAHLPVCREGTLEWVRIDRVPALPIWEGDRIFLRLLAENAPFFHLELHYDGDCLQSACLDGRALALPGRQAAEICPGPGIFA